MGDKLLRGLGQGLQVGGILGGGKSAQEQAEANAAIDRADAERTMEESRRRANVIREQGRSAAGREKVRAAGAGFTQEGTSLQLQIDQIAAAEFNALEELRVGKAAEERSNQAAQLNVRRGKVARRGSLLNAATTGLGFMASQRSRAFESAFSQTGRDAASSKASIGRDAKSALSKQKRKAARKLRDA